MKPGYYVLRDCLVWRVSSPGRYDWREWIRKDRRESLPTKGQFTRGSMMRQSGERTTALWVRLKVGEVPK